MIMHPRPGQTVRVHYATKPRKGATKLLSEIMPYHGRLGVVRIVGKGPGPRNIGVEIDGKIIVIPRGNPVGFRGPC